MINDILKYCLLLVIFWIIGYILMHCTGKGKLNKLIRGFAYLGIFFHELSHYIIAKLVHVKVYSFQIGKDDEKLYGSVIVDDNINFLQSFLIGIAPFLISTYLLTLVLQYLYSPFYDLYISIIFLALSFSLILGSVPSFQDWKAITSSIRLNPEFTIYQIFLIIIIFYLKQLIFSEGQIIIGFEPLNSIIIIGGFYYLIRYSVKGPILLFKHIHSRFHYNKLYNPKTKTKLKNTKNFQTEVISTSLDYIPSDINYVRYNPKARKSIELQELHENDGDNSHISHKMKKKLERDSWLTKYFAEICISLFFFSQYILIIITVIIESTELFVWLTTLFILYVIVVRMADWDLSINYHYKRDVLINILKIFTIVPVLVRKIKNWRYQRDWNKWHVEKYGLKPPQAQW